MTSLALLAALILGAPENVHRTYHPQAAQGLRVAAARRTLEYQTVDMRTIRPSEPATDVLLLVDLAGITVEEFQKLQPKDIHLMSGETRHETVMSGAGLVNGKAEIHVLFSVPKDAANLQLVVSGHPPVRFTAPPTVHASIGR